jgi:lipoprotein-anchoring transpeptidase ErfK/SrfK
MAAAAVTTPVALTACAPTPPVADAPVVSPRAGARRGVLPPITDIPPNAYAALPDERFPLDAVDLSEVDTDFLRAVVPYDGPYRPGTIFVMTSERRLYLPQSNGTAIRYGVGVGRDGARWRGRAAIGRKEEWPNWRPTDRMIAREPEKNRPWAGGMPGGPENPLGARALYLHEGGRDTMYRIHGTNEPWSIGQNVSSGCIRLLNHDIIDLYDRAPMGTQVMVLA